MIILGIRYLLAGVLAAMAHPGAGPGLLSLDLEGIPSIMKYLCFYSAGRCCHPQIL